MFAWMKVFTDGTCEQGTAAQIKAGKASWSKGRLEGIERVHLACSYPASFIMISVPDTEWYQFERYILDLSSEELPKSILSCVQAKIKKEHIGMYITKETKGSYNLFISIESIQGKDSVIITEDFVGKWISVAAHKKGKPYYTITDRGKFE